MIGDGKEHVCSGCYEIIATHDPEAFQRGNFYYHSAAHEDRHAARSRNRFPSANGQQAQEALAEASAGS
jgi:hypothetical protein